MVDCIYVASSTLDARLTRICVASVRRFYPDVPIRLLVGGRLQGGLKEELARFWNVTVADVPEGDYGWGFVKLEPLFARAGERFLMLDADTAFSGPVLDMLDGSTAPFVVDNEHYPDEAVPERYYDWTKVRAADPAAVKPSFVFNSGQWVGASGVLTRADFDPWVEWTFPRKLRRPDLFFPGDQGVLNYVLVQKALTQGLQVDRLPLMRWPGHGLEGFDRQTVAEGRAQPAIIHWAGMKKLRHSDMIGADLLAFFEDAYYQPLPSGRTRRNVALAYNARAHVWHALHTRFRQRLQRLRSKAG